MRTQPNTVMKRMINRPSPVWMALGVVALLTATGCQTNPYTGRWQLMMVPMSQEVQMGVVNGTDHPRALLRHSVLEQNHGHPVRRPQKMPEL